MVRVPLWMKLENTGHVTEVTHRRLQLDDSIYMSRPGQGNLQKQKTDWRLPRTGRREKMGGMGSGC